MGGGCPGDAGGGGRRPFPDPGGAGRLRGTHPPAAQAGRLGVGAAIQGSGVGKGTISHLGSDEGPRRGWRKLKRDRPKVGREEEISTKDAKGSVQTGNILYTINPERGRPRLIEVGEIGVAVPGLVRAGRPRSQEDLSMGLRLRPSAAAAWRLHSNPGWMPGDNLLENPIPRQARAPSTGSNTPPPRAPTATIRSTTAPRPCKPSWSNCSPKPTRNPPMRSFSTSTPPTIPSTGSKRTASSRYGYY